MPSARRRGHDGEGAEDGGRGGGLAAKMATEDSRAMSMFVGRGHRQRGEQGVEGVALLPVWSR